MILLLGGTAETPDLARALKEAGEEVMVSAYTALGARLAGPGVATRWGPLDREGLQNLIETVGLTGVIDATHPYAVDVTANARSAAAAAEVPYLRYERPPGPELPGAVRCFATLADLAAAAREFPGVIFFTIGSRQLAAFRRLAPEVELVARILPDPDSLQAALAAGLEPRQIIALQGPVSRELNRELFREKGARAVVTKESGEAGGVLAKAEAAMDLNLPLLVWQRPPARGDECRDREELVRRWKEMQHGRGGPDRPR